MPEDKAKEVKETKEVVKKCEKPEKAVKDDANFEWKKASKVEQICFIISMVTVVAALIFVILEFDNNCYAWASEWFRVCFGVSFLAESVCYWKIRRNLAIVTLACGAVMLLLGILGLAGVL